jgi:hypothetical protein
MADRNPDRTDDRLARPGFDFTLVAVVVVLGIFLIGTGITGLWLFDGFAGLDGWLAAIAIAVGTGLLLLCLVAALLARAKRDDRPLTALTGSSATRENTERIAHLLSTVRELNAHLDAAVTLVRAQAGSIASPAASACRFPAANIGETPAASRAQELTSRTLH